MSNTSNHNNRGLDVNNVSVIYRNGHQALHDVSFSIPTGSIAALVGINGSGKSTLFKSIMGFVTLAKGNVDILGKKNKHALKNNMVAYVPQSEEVDWNFPVLVEDVVMMGRYGYMGWLKIPKSEDRDAVAEALQRVDMQKYAKRQIGELSGGQKKRVFLARSLAQQSQVILLDEPFTGVDVKTEEQITNLLLEMKGEGKLMLVATHNLGSVPNFCDKTILLNKTIINYGDTDKIFTQDNLEKTFGGVLRHFVLTGNDLHDDNDKRSVTVLTDDERPFVIYEDNNKKSDN